MKSSTLVAILISITLSACGGSSGSNNSGSGGNGASTGGGNSGSGTPSTSNPVTTGYLDFNYLQNVNGTPASTTASIVDKGQNNANAITFFNGSATVTTTSGGYNWGSPLTAGVGISTASNNSNVPSVIELCENISGVSSTKSIDVLVQGKATAITNATGLANQTFGTYREDCGTSTSGWGGSTLVFDSNGNATSGSVTLTAAQITSMLSGTPNTTIVSGGFATFNAYSYQDAYGATGYAIVEHLAGSVNNPTKGVVSVWTK
ncbi:hypothetical protein [Undibacterium sp. SXout20W]|uniref:hypothetical protein n=1 Tax=Undibacterium sp. SXout20W TaxID=3413051 RepID=UPI003BF1E447